MVPPSIGGDAVSLDAVRKYLTENFPDADIPAPTDFGGAATGRVFWIEEADYNTHQLELGRSVYEGRSVADLISLLDAHTVVETMRANPDTRLVIAATRAGGIRYDIEALRR